MEVWKDIKGYDGLYQVSNLGRVKSLKFKRGTKEKLLKIVIAKNGYCYVTLCKNETYKGMRVHRLVAEAFLPNPQNKPQVNHKDENKHNNNVKNLEWATSIENLNHGSRNEKDSKAHSISVYCVELNQVFESLKIASNILNISRGNICMCCKGKRKTAGGYHWKYVN